jgi:predicted TIM-barrel fold metal-dependent hydrolase
MSNAYQRISVGSHVNPLPTMWAEYLPAAFRERAPKIVERSHPRRGTIEMLSFEGRESPFNFISADAGVSSEAAEPIGRKFSDGRPGGYDPAARLQDLDRDGVDAELLFDGVSMLKTEDRDLKFAMIQAYNNWLVDFCRHAPSRLFGIAYLPTWDAHLAAQEAKRCRALGLRGVLIPTIPGIETPYSMPAEHQYNHPAWVPLWQMLEELDMPAHFHVDQGTIAKEFYTDTIILMIANKSMVSEPMAVFCCSGVLERHPRLKIVSVESGVGWMAFAVPWMDLVFERHRHYTGYKLKEKPSFYFHRQFHGTYIQDVVGIRNRDIIGVGNILWCNDYPHVDGIWPQSSASIDEHMEGVSAADRHAILAGNAVRLYGL